MELKEAVKILKDFEKKHLTQIVKTAWNLTDVQIKSNSIYVAELELERLLVKANVINESLDSHAKIASKIYKFVRL